MRKCDARLTRMPRAVFCPSPFPSRPEHRAVPALAHASMPTADEDFRVTLVAAQLP